jgi:pimeloyl-ACP methyl ester carboxylesterase
VLLVAHSGGAAVAVRYARQHAARVAALVSAEGNLAPSDAFLSSRIAAMPLDAVETWLDAARANPTLLLDKERRRFMPDQVERLSEWLDYQPASTVHAAARALLMETVRSAYADEVAGVMKQTPTYLIRGETTPAGLGAPLRFEKLAAGTFVVPGAGHAMVLEAPQIVAMHLRQVLERLDGIGEAA